MSSFSIRPCTILDSDAIAATTIMAFWANPSWVLMWKGQTREAVIATAQKRMPHQLLHDRERKRHEKAVDSAGALLGYARWVLPADVEDGVPAERCWLDAKVPDPGVEARTEAARVFGVTERRYDHALDGLDEVIEGVRKRLVEGRRFLCTSDSLCSSFHFLTYYSPIS